MIRPLFVNTRKTIQYICIWVIYGLIQFYIFKDLVNISPTLMLMDGMWHGVSWGIIGILLWNVMKYANFSMLSIYQRIVNISALAITSVTAWIAISYAAEYLILNEKTASVFIKIMPARFFIGMLIYFVMLALYRLNNVNTKTEQLPANEKQPEETTFPEISSEASIDLETPAEMLERIAVKSGSKIHVIQIQEIIYFQADGDYVQIYTTNGKYLKEQTMKYLTEHLPINQFVRVHRSIIVNIEMISRIELYEKQSQQLTLKNGMQIKTSPSGYKALKAALSL